MLRKSHWRKYQRYRIKEKTMQNNFEEVAKIIVKIANERGYHFPSAIIAQAICESAWGGSLLSSKYFNYFGMKCGKGWKGAAVDLKTKEEYKPGTLTSVTAKFRAYDSITAGINGYFDFIEQYPRYSNLKDAVSAEDYIVKIKSDGWATSFKYVNTLTTILHNNNLTEFDNIANITEVIKPEEVTANERAIAEDVIRGKYGNGVQRKDNLYKAVQRAVNLALAQR